MRVKPSHNGAVSHAYHVIFWPESVYTNPPDSVLLKVITCLTIVQSTAALQQPSYYALVAGLSVN